MRTVIDELGLNAVVHNCRIEALQGVDADIVTARALASLGELLPLAARILKKDGVCLFLKGQNIDVELTDAKKYWMFECTKTQSLSDPSGRIVMIRNLKNDGKFKQFRRK